MNDKGTILVVDDNELIRKLATKLLSKKSYAVTVATNGREALELIRINSPDVILLDVMMPEMDGFECCRLLKKNETTMDIPVILMSSNTETIDKIKGFEIGAADYIVKPFDYGELIARVSTQIKMKNLLDELGSKNALLEELVKKDSLTSLYNHRYFHEHLAAVFDISVCTKQPLSCLVCDVDLFKSINDMHGHQAGDEILKTLAGIFMNMIDTDDVACRYGGDEFAFILPNSNSTDAIALSERIRYCIEKKDFIFGDISIPVTISMGVASLLDNHVLSHIELISFADEALYAAKQAGRNKTMASNT